MAFQPGQSGNKAGRPPAEKAFANMLRIALAEAHGKGTKLRAVADAVVNEAIDGNVAAINTIADRIDGKVPQALVGDEDYDPLRVVAEIRRFIVDPKDTNGGTDNRDGSGIPAAPEPISV